MPESTLNPRVFISYSGHDQFEASLLQFALETLLSDKNLIAWTYQRDQRRSEREIAQSLKDQVRESCATVFLVSPIVILIGFDHATQAILDYYGKDEDEWGIENMLLRKDLEEGESGMCNYCYHMWSKDD